MASTSALRIFLASSSEKSSPMYSATACSVVEPVGAPPDASSSGPTQGGGLSALDAGCRDGAADRADTRAETGRDEERADDDEIRVDGDDRGRDVRGTDEGEPLVRGILRQWISMCNLLARKNRSTLARHQKLTEGVRQKEQQQKAKTSDSIFARKIILLREKSFLASLAPLGRREINFVCRACMDTDS